MGIEINHKPSRSAYSGRKRGINMKFTKYNNPSKRRPRKRLNKSEADIIAVKNMLIDKRLGYEVPVSVYDEKR